MMHLHSLIFFTFDYFLINLYLLNLTKFKKIKKIKKYKTFIQYARLLVTNQKKKRYKQIKE